MAKKAKIKLLKKSELPKGIRQRKDSGKFFFRFNADRKTYYKEFETKEEARKGYLIARAEVAEGKYNNSKVTLNQLIEQVLTIDKANGTRCINSLKLHNGFKKSCIENSVALRFGKIPVKDIEVKECNNWLLEQLRYHKTKIVKGKTVDNGKLSTNTINRYIDMLKGYLSRAVKLGYIQYNPMERIDRPKAQKVNKDREALTDVELTMFLSTIKERSPKGWVMALAMLDTGARVHECLGLQWKNIDNDSSKIAIEGQYDPITKTKKDIKNGVKRTWVAKTSTIRELINIKPVNANKEDYIFKGYKDNSPLGVGRVEQIFRSVFKICGIKKTPHSLRHTGATLLWKATGDIRLVQKFLGHKNIATTQKYINDNFTEVSKEETESIKNALPDFVEKSNQPILRVVA